LELQTILRRGRRWFYDDGDEPEHFFVEARELTRAFALAVDYVPANT
jgi:hypothetical protein